MRRSKPILHRGSDVSRYGVVELGGTKTLVATGAHPDDLAPVERIETTDPSATLNRVVEVLAGSDIEAAGVACFGPLELRRDHPGFGEITNTPKPGWSGAPVRSRLAAALAVPVGIDTDVNGAALGEGRWGAAAGLSHFVYVTVGTGIGGGAVVEGETLIGLGHPEMGHLVVERRFDDDYPGRCPFHGACLEGMASGPALEDRFGPVASWDQSEVLDLVVFYLAQGLRGMVYTLAPQRIVVGGGVSKIAGFHHYLGEALVDQLAGYPGIEDHQSHDFVMPPSLGDRSGLAGALLLAAKATR
jgi:fructokinase